MLRDLCAQEIWANRASNKATTKRLWSCLCICKFIIPPYPHNLRSPILEYGLGLLSGLTYIHIYIYINPYHTPSVPTNLLILQQTWAYCIRTRPDNLHSPKKKSKISRTSLAHSRVGPPKSLASSPTNCTLEACTLVTATKCNILQHTATYCNILQHTATYCNILQHTATHCNILQHTATYCNIPQHTATHCNILQHTATYCNILQHTAAYCNTLQHTATYWDILQHTATHCNILQHTATYCNTLQHAATHYMQTIKSYNTLQHNAVQCNTLQHTATHCNTLQHTATHCNILQHSTTLCTNTALTLQHNCNTPVEHMHAYRHVQTYRCPCIQTIQHNATLCKHCNNCNTP